MRDPNNIMKEYELEAPPAIIKIDDIPDYNLYIFSASFSVPWCNAL